MSKRKASLFVTCSYSAQLDINTPPCVFLFSFFGVLALPGAVTLLDLKNHEALYFLLAQPGFLSAVTHLGLKHFDEALHEVLLRCLRRRGYYYGKYKSYKSLALLVLRTWASNILMRHFMKFLTSSHTESSTCTQSKRDAQDHQMKRLLCTVLEQRA